MTSQTSLPQRSLLAVPATSPRFLEKGAQSPADAVFIDLEDAVVPDLKVDARARAIEAINGLDWGRRILCVRVNGLTTAWGCRDLIELAEHCPRLDRVLLPKCETAQDIHAVSVMLAAGEQAARRERPIEILAIIESAKGVANAEDIARCGGRLAGMVFGSGDYQVDLRSVQGGVGAPSPDYVVLTDANARGERERHWNDLWHFATARIANACRAYGLTPIDGPFSAIADADGLAAAARRALALGFEGKMAIHPSQLEAINTVFSPSPEQVQWARDALEALEQAAREGKGAVKDKHGEMLDLMHLKLARVVLDRAEVIAGKDRA